jgi:hypothetical protein
MRQSPPSSAPASRQQNDLAISSSSPATLYPAELRVRRRPFSHWPKVGNGLAGADLGGARLQRHRSDVRIVSGAPKLLVVIAQLSFTRREQNGELSVSSILCRFQTLMRAALGLIA